MVWGKPAIDFEHLGKLVFFLYLAYPAEIGLVAVLYTAPGIVLETNVIRSHESPPVITVAPGHSGNSCRKNVHSGVWFTRAVASTMIAIGVKMISVVLMPSFAFVANHQNLWPEPAQTAGIC